MAYVDDLKIELAEVKSLDKYPQWWSVLHNKRRHRRHQDGHASCYNSLNNHRIQLGREIAALENRCAVRVRPVVTYADNYR